MIDGFEQYIAHRNPCPKDEYDNYEDQCHYTQAHLDCTSEYILLVRSLMKTLRLIIDQATDEVTSSCSGDKRLLDLFKAAKLFIAIATENGKLNYVQADGEMYGSVPDVPVWPREKSCACGENCPHRIDYPSSTDTPDEHDEG